MSTRLPVRTSAELVLEQRVPATHSASEEEHAWHRVPHVSLVDAKDLSAAEALEHADVLLAAVKPRQDYELRVVLRRLEVTQWVLA